MSLIFSLLLAAALLCGYWLYCRQCWARVANDQNIANLAIKRIEQAAKGWQTAVRDDRMIWLENARRQLKAANRCLAQNARYKIVRTYLDDALWWLAQLLIVEEPEYLQDLYGEHRAMVKQLFWGWNGSMEWDGAPANKEQYVLRHVRLSLYREIKSLAATKLLDEGILAAARDCLKKRDFPGDTQNARLDAERIYITGALRALRSRRDAALGRTTQPQ